MGVLALGAAFAGRLACAEGSYQEESAKLPFTPYSSSYLPYDEGYLTEVEGRGPSRDLAPLLDRIADSRSPVGDRFDALRERVLGARKPLSTWLDANLYKPSEPYWEGLCHQWSAGALDPQLARILANQQDVVCHGVYLSKGEIRELITAFYHNLQPLVGYRSYQPIDPDVLRVRAALGTDSLRAHVFHETVYDNLSKGQGVIASLSLPPEIWNYPIYQAQSRKWTVGPDLLRRLKPLPAYVFQGSDTALLDAYTTLEKELYNLSLSRDPRTDGAAAAADDGSLMSQAISKATALGIGESEYQGTDPLDTLFKLRIALYRRILGGVQRGTVSLNPDYQITWVDTQIVFAVESDFATGRNESASRRLGYVMIKHRDEDVPTDSIWLTPPAGRPAFLWLPKDLSSNPQADPLARNLYTQDPGLGDLVEILRRCPGTQALASFQDLLQRAQDRNRLSPEEREQLLGAYCGLKGQYDRAELARELQGVGGISLADFPEFNEACAGPPPPAPEVERPTVADPDPVRPAVGRID